MDTRPSRSDCPKILEVSWIRFSQTFPAKNWHFLGAFCSFFSGKTNMQYLPNASSASNKQQRIRRSRKLLRKIHQFNQWNRGSIGNSASSEWLVYQISKQLPSKFCNHTGRLQTSFQKRPLIVSVWKLVLLSHNLVELLWFNHPLFLSLPSY